MENVTSNALSQIQENYAQEMAYLQAIKTDEGTIAAEQAMAKADKAGEYTHYSHWSWGACGHTSGTDYHASKAEAYSAEEHDISQLSQKVQGLESQIEKLAPSDSTLEDLFGALNGLNMGSSKTNGEKGNFLDSSDFNKALNTLEKMITEQMEIDEDADEANSSSNVSQSDLKALQQETSLQALESSQLDGLFSALDSSREAYTKDLNQAGVGAAGQNQVDATLDSIGITGMGGENSKKFALERIIKEAQGALVSIESAMINLSSIKADMVNQAFQPIEFALTGIEREVKTILNSKVPASVKAEKLGKLLQLVLGFLQVLIQTADTLKTQNKQKMAQANIQAQKLNLQDITADGQIYNELKAQAAKMKTVQKVLTGLEIFAAVAFTLMGSVGFAVAMIAMTVATQTGLTTDLTNALSKRYQNDGQSEANAQVEASATTDGIAMMATLLGGAGIDALVQNLERTLVKEAVEESVQAASQEISVSARSLTESEPDMTPEEAQIKAKNIATESATIAAKETVKKMYQRSFGSILGYVARAAARNMSNFAERFSASAAEKLASFGDGKVLSEELENAVSKATKDAVSQAVNEMTKLSENGAPLLEKDIQTIAKRAANVSLKKIGEESVAAERTFLEKLKSGEYRNQTATVFAGMYMMGSTNFLIDLAQAAQARDHDVSEEKFQQIVETTMEVIQALMQAIAVLKGGGFDTAVLSDEPMPALNMAQKASNVAMTGSQIGQGSVDINQGEIDEKQAAVQENFQLVQSFDSFLKTMRDDQNNGEDKPASGFASEIQFLEKEQSFLAAHMWDGFSAGCRVLAARSV